MNRFINKRPILKKAFDTFLRRRFFSLWRRAHPEQWDLSEVVFSNLLPKEEFLTVYPLVPGGKIYTGYIVNFTGTKSLTVKSIFIVHNEGVSPVALTKKELINRLEGICPIIKEANKSRVLK